MLKSKIIQHFVLITPTPFGSDPMIYGTKGDFDTSQAKLSGILSAVFTVLRLLGILLLVYAIYETIIAFQSENTESKVRSVAMIVIAIAIIFLKTIVNEILKGTGVRVS